MPRLLLPLIALLGACASDQGLGTHADVGGGDGPDIQVDPMRLEFGAAAAGEVVTQSFTITNVGSGDLEVSGITLGDTSASFTILTEDLSLTLPHDATAVIEVAFTPQGAEEYAQAIVDSNDEDERKVPVELFGEGLVPELEVTPDPLDFGEMWVGCEADQEVTLTNVGTDLLVVTDVTHAGDGFSFFYGDALPLELDPGESASATLIFGPEADTSYAGGLSVTSNEPLGVRTVASSGVGTYAGPYTDTFEVPTDPPADILFFVDQSCSMDDDARALAGQFSNFITQLSNYTTDWHIMVVNDDDGCNNSSVLTSRSSGYEDRFEEAVGRGGGNYTEAGLIVTSRAVDKTDASECNDNFLRSSAMLHIILVSDEPEQSPGNWDTYVNEVVAKKGDASLVKFSAVAGDMPSGCSSSSNSADAGTGYYDAVSATGGEWLSICSNWSTHVQALAEASVDVDTFALQHTPAPSTIVVKVDGSRQNGGWTYDSAQNAVVFDSGRVPEEGSTIEVEYSGLANCD